MKIVRIVAALTLALGMAGCATVDTVTRNASIDMANPGGATQALRSYTVTAVHTVVPETLRVSEANSYYPITDIVWRGDPLGDRHKQLEAIFDEAAARGAEKLQGAVPVVVDIELHRFHGVTERTRYTIGGIYTIVFTMTVRNAETGAIIEGPRRVEADLPAPGGMAAIHQDQIGQTEKVRVTEFLTMELVKQLTGPIPRPGTF